MRLRFGPWRLCGGPCFVLGVVADMTCTLQKNVVDTFHQMDGDRHVTRAAGVAFTWCWPHGHRYRAWFVRLTSQPYVSPGTQTWPSTKSTRNWRVWAPPCRAGPVIKWVRFVLRHSKRLINAKQVKRLIRKRVRLLSGSNCIFNYSLGMGTGECMLSQILIIQWRLISNLSKV